MRDHFYLARKMLQAHEGLRLTEYTDTTGHRTIGYGWNLDAKPLPKTVGQVISGKLSISEHEAQSMLDISMLDHWRELVGAFPWVNEQDAWRKAILLDMAFNLGIPTLRTFKNTLAAIQHKDYKTASENMLKSKWATQAKRRADVLAEIMRLGFMPAALMQTYQINMNMA